MRKKLKRYLKYQLIVQKKRDKRRLSSAKRQRLKRKGIGAFEKYTPTGKHKSYQNKPNIIRLPEALSFCNNKRIYIKQLINCMIRIKKTATLGGTIIIDLAKVKRQSPDGVIYIKATLDRVKQEYPSCKFQLNGIDNGMTIMAVFKQIGILDIISMDYQSNIDDQNIIHWKHSSGNNIEGKKFDDLWNIEDNSLKSKKFYKSFTEAVTNVTQHAHDKGHTLKGNLWWSFSQQKDKTLTLCVCDLGVGICETMHRAKPKLKKIYDRLRHNQGALLKKIIKDGLSSTKEDYRGKGLINMQPSKMGIENVSFSIISNKGCYMVDSHGQETTEILKTQLNGTIITWNIPL